MLRKQRICGLGIVLMLGFLSTAFADDMGVALGVREHVQHSAFSDYPFGEGDLSYAAALESGNDLAVWQLVADYAPSVSGTNHVDYVITPALNLMIRDRIFRGGLGILSSYVSGSDSKWLDLYFQFILGLDIPLSKKFSIEAYSYYPFKRWDKLSDFDFADIEFGAWLTYHF